MDPERWIDGGVGEESISEYVFHSLPVCVVSTTGSLLFLNPAVLIAMTTTL